MTLVASTPRPPVAVRRLGYLVAAMLTAGFWYLVNVSPGWSAPPFLTDDAGRVVALLNLSVIASLVVNVLYLVYDEPWCRTGGDLVTTGFGLAVLVRLWQVFPFAFTGSFDWPLVVRGVLVLAIVGSVIGMVANLVALARWAARAGGSDPARRSVP